MGEKHKYRPPVYPDSGPPPKEKKEYIPPVGPDSKSVPPSGSFRELPDGLLPTISKVGE